MYRTVWIWIKANKRKWEEKYWDISFLFVSKRQREIKEVLQSKIKINEEVVNLKKLNNLQSFAETLLC